MIKTLAIDFDGVIHRYSKGWHDGTIYDDPMTGAIEGLSWLMDQYAVFVFTTRSPTQVCDWLEEFEFETTDVIPSSGFWNEEGVLLVTNYKLPAVAYIDDRAHQFANWPMLLDDFIDEELE